MKGHITFLLSFTIKDKGHNSKITLLICWGGGNPIRKYFESFSIINILSTKLQISDTLFSKYWKTYMSNLNICGANHTPLAKKKLTKSKNSLKSESPKGLWNTNLSYKFFQVSDPQRLGFLCNHPKRQVFFKCSAHPIISKAF